MIEHGPNAIPLSPTQDAPVGPCQELVDLSQVPVDPAPTNAARYAVASGRLQPVPLDPPALLKSPLLPARAKVRLLAEPWIKPMSGSGSVHTLVTRRLGQRVAPLLDAFVSGIYAGDPKRLSAHWAFPRIQRMDQDGGFIRSMRRKTAPRTQPYAPRGGMRSLVEALAERLDIRTGTEVTGVTPEHKGVRVDTSRRARSAERCIIALPPGPAGRILEITEPPPCIAPVTIVAFGVDESRAPSSGYGFLVPEEENRFVLGCLYESAQWPERAPPGRALLRCFVGGRRHPQRAELPERALIDAAWRDLQDLDVVEGQPTHARVIRTRGIPQLEASHEEWVAALPTNGPVRVIGIGHRGVGLQALANEAREVAEDLAKRGD